MDKQEFTKKRIVIANRKGGVGKTTVATHIAAGIALRGYRVALVDTDAQGHDALLVGLPKMDGLYNVMCADASLAEMIYVVDPMRFTPPGAPLESALYLLPGDKRTALIPYEQQNPFRFSNVIDDMIAMLNLDLVVIDTGPTASMFDGSVNVAADGFVYVTECASLSFDGLNESLTEIEAINREKVRMKLPATEMLGIIPNKYRHSTNNQRDNIQDLGRYFEGLVWPMLTQREAWSTATKYGQLMYSYLHGGPEEAEMLAIVDRLIAALTPPKPEENPEAVMS
jgi:chromosome partitioning protein